MAMATAAVQIKTATTIEFPLPKMVTATQPVLINKGGKHHPVLRRPRIVQGGTGTGIPTPTGTTLATSKVAPNKPKPAITIKLCCHKMVVSTVFQINRLEIIIVRT